MIFLYLITFCVLCNQELKADGLNVFLLLFLAISWRQNQMGAQILLCDGFDEPSKVTTEEEYDTVFAGESSLGETAEEDLEEWCGENRFCFYLVKQLTYDDPEIKAKIDEADNEIYRCNSERIHIANRLKVKREERLSLVAQMENLISLLDEYNSMFTHQSMAVDINEVMKEQEVVTRKINSLSERLSDMNMEIELLDAQMGCVLDQRDKAFERIKILRLQRDNGNAAFFQSRVVMKKALELAASGNVRDLEELTTSEVEKFMSRWNTDKAFRDDYEKRILPSLDERELRCDEWIRNPEGENGNETAEKKAIEHNRFITEEESDDTMDFYIPVYEKLPKEEEEIDEEALKEKKREEQVEKTRLAMERKRKLHEKAAAKAAIRVKKEAEKKLKELEKRAKKKEMAAAFNSSSPSDTVTEASGAEKAGKEKRLNGRSVFPKQRSFKYRQHGKGNEAVPKAIMKRRKAYRLWVWTVSSTALALPLVLLIAFFYIR